LLIFDRFLTASVAKSVWQPQNQANDRKKIMDSSAGRQASFTTGRGLFLILPCDWRFLPKLGPLRFCARAFFVPSRFCFRCHEIMRAF
jgi:hypothetical protein